MEGRFKSGTKACGGVNRRRFIAGLLGAAAYLAFWRPRIPWAAHRRDPHRDAIEDATLGAVLENPDAAGEVAAMLRPSDFRGPWNSLVFLFVKLVRRDGEVADLEAVASSLERAGMIEDIGGRRRLAELAVAAPAPAHARLYAESLQRLCRGVA